MDKFNFRFDTILSTKEKIEDDKKNKLGISMKKLAIQREHLDKLFQKKNDIIVQIDHKSQNKVKIRELRNLYTNLDRIQTIINNQTNVVMEQESETQNRRKDLLEASKQKKVFEKLKEKDFEEFKYSQLKNEIALTDEIISYKAANR